MHDLWELDPLEPRVAEQIDGLADVARLDGHVHLVEEHRARLEHARLRTMNGRGGAHALGEPAEKGEEDDVLEDVLPDARPHHFERELGLTVPREKDLADRAGADALHDLQARVRGRHARERSGEAPPVRDVRCQLRQLDAEAGRQVRVHGAALADFAEDWAHGLQRPARRMPQRKRREDAEFQRGDGQLGEAAQDDEAAREGSMAREQTVSAQGEHWSFRVTSVRLTVRVPARRRYSSKGCPE